MRLTLLIAALLSAAFAQDDGGSRLALAGHGRFAVFADLDSLSRDGGAARMRAFQVVESGFSVGDRPFWGGWSWWDFDCAAGTADRLDFAAVAEGGIEGPATPEDAPPYPAAPGGDAGELLAIACATSRPPIAADSLARAVVLGRTLLAE